MNSTPSNPSPANRAGRWTLRIFGVVLALMGIALGMGGLKLAQLGGSWYYLITGVALVVSGALFCLRREAGAWLFGAVFAGTVLWALWEAGLSFWPLVPRLAPVLVLAMFTLLLLPALTQGRVRNSARALAGVALLALIAGGMAMFQPHGVIEAASAPAAQAATPPATGDANRWQFYGRTPAGTRFAPLDQITKDNVNQLQVAWTFHTGELAKGGSEDQNTPMQIGDTVYVCTPRNKIFALDADTCKQRWTFDAKPADTVWNRCRGLGYYESPALAAAGPEAVCKQRIVMTTVDARLITLDAKSGAPCPGFGRQGTVDLKQGMGEIKPMYYFQTSAPTVARNLIIVGGWVFDGREVDEPSGAVRAFDADTSALAWAWDVGNPAIDKLPPPGQSYTRSTPNVWTTPAFDDKLGLVYLPTGNCPPDFFGGQRPKVCDDYGSTIVAVDLATGKERWKFTTVHHDLWDYDLPAQPALYDVPDGQGGTVPALIQVTKRGQIFMLDRRNGTPIAAVEERPVPQGAAPGERLSPTQPYSVGLPAIGAEPMTEARMWGATWFDQLACRIKFRSVRYEGEFTPPGVDRPSMNFPGFVGGMNWGSVSVDAANQRVFVSDIRVPSVFQLVPRAEFDEFKKKYPPVSDGHGPSMQLGTPYGVYTNIWFSALGVQCVQPPFGTITAIDLKTRQVAWQVPAGTAEQLGPMGIKLGLPMPIGMPSYGGTLATAGGLVFFSGYQDYYLRAYDAETGRELWKYALPVGSSATPMTYVSPKTGRQYVVVSTGGSAYSKNRSDLVMAFALPQR